MLKIALIGAPRSAKSATAFALEDAIVRADLECRNCITPVKVVDDYVSEVEERMQYVAGFDGDYAVNLAIALDRLGRERQAAAEGAKTIITVGSLLETATYQAMTFEAEHRFDSEEAKLDEARRVEATFKTIACLYMDTFTYHHVFYFPPLEVEDKRVGGFDRNLQAAFAAFNLVEVTPILVEDGNVFEIVEQRVERIMDQLELSKEEVHEGDVERAGDSTSTADGSGVHES